MKEKQQNNALLRVVKCFYVSIFLSVLVISSTIAQENNQIRHLQTNRGDEIEFRSSEKKVLKVINVLNSNPYSKLKYQSTSLSGKVNYKISNTDKAELLSSFFLNASKHEIRRLNPSGLKASSDILLNGNYVVVADHLTMYGGEGVLGVKSIATVFNREGIKVAVLPENNDGYFSPVVTENGKYLATNYGDVADHVDFTLLPTPGFRIYDTNTNSVIYELSSTNHFDVLPPSVDNDMIIEVLRYPNDQYEYIVFRPEERILFKKKFSREEVGRLVRFSSDGLVMKINGREELVRFDTGFTQSSF